MRIILDVAHPGIIDEALDAVRWISGRASIAPRPERCVEVYSDCKHWPCLFPQHGPGVKRERPIVLAD